MPKSTRPRMIELFSLDLKEDCIRETFCAGGRGGKDRRENGARMIHKASGAVGAARRFPDQYRNERMALANLSETQAFREWQKTELLRYYSRYYSKGH